MHDQRVLCSGANTESELVADGAQSYDVPTRWNRFPLVDDLHVGHGFACALLPTGKVACWGSRLWGRVGDGCALSPSADTVCNGQPPAPGEGTRHTAAVVAQLPPVVQLAGGWDATCVRTQAGEIWCWGSNIDGELGSPDLEYVTTPRRVAVPAASQLLAGASHFCAVAVSDQRIWCWGNAFIDDARSHDERDVRTPKAMDEIGRLPRGGRLVMTLWGGCVIDADAVARCWGSMDAPDEPPTRATEPWVTIAGVHDVAAGNDHLCIVTTAGVVRCGTANATLAGAGRSAEASFAYGWHEVRMPFEAPAASLHAKPYATCALSTKGEVACWGQNDVGQLGVRMPDRDQDSRVWQPTAPSWPQ